MCGSLPILGKAQRCIYTFMLSMRMEQQLERIQFSSTMYSKGSTFKPISPREPFFVGPPPALKLFSTLEPSIVKSIEELTGSVTHVSSGLLQRNKALFTKTGADGVKHLLAAPNPAITKRALLPFQQQQSNFDKATFVVLDTNTTKRLFKDWTRIHVQNVGEMNAVYVWNKTISDEPECLMFTSEGHTMVLKGTVNGVSTKILLDTGASGTAFIRRQFCKDESIQVKPAKTWNYCYLGRWV